MFGAIFHECFNLFATQFFFDWQVLVERGYIVIGRGDYLLRTEYLNAAVVKSGECLGAGHFMDQVFVDI